MLTINELELRFLAKNLVCEISLKSIQLLAFVHYHGHTLKNENFYRQNWLGVSPRLECLLLYLTTPPLRKG